MMKKQEKCQQIIACHVPQLVQLLLNGKEEEQEQQELDAKYAECLQYALHRLQNYKNPRSSYESVMRNMDNFVERFRLEQLNELSETIKMLGQVVLDDQHCPEDLKYTVLEFMLSVNYKAFHTALVQKPKIMLRRSNLLEALATAYREREEALNRSVKDYMPCSLNRSHEFEFDASSTNSLSDTSLESFKDTSAEQQQIMQFDQLDEHNDRVERLNFALALQKLQQLQEQEEKQVSDNDISMQFAGTRSFSRFAVSFAEYLGRPLQDVKLALLQFGEVGFLLRELLRMFFQPNNCRNFEVVDQLIQLRSSGSPLLQHFERPLQQMQLLQVFIDCHEKHLEIMCCLKKAFRRLLKPVVESLTYFEQHVASSKRQATVQTFQRATMHSWQRLQLLWHLAVACDVLQPQLQGVAAHRLSHHLVCNLLKVTMKGDELRSSAAALLLHVLQVYCQFLDSWWQLGKFQDQRDEFLVMRVPEIENSEYVLRDLDSQQETCAIHRIIGEHIKNAGHSLAVLNDSKKLTDFVVMHRSMLKKSLHHQLAKCILHLLQPYQLKTVQKIRTAPDIFNQLKSTENEQMRTLYYAYYKESLLNFKQPTICGIDELLKQCQNCVSYTPFHELICLSLERVLEPRVLLVNSFVVHLLRADLQLDKVLMHLRSVYLLLNFSDFGEHFGIAMKQLQLGSIPAATKQLQDIFNSQYPRLGSPFRVELSEARLEQISLHYNCEPGLSCIINESQLKLYHIAFRRMLQLHVGIRQLQQLTYQPSQFVAVTILQELKEKLEMSLVRHLKAKQLQQAADQCDTELQLAVSLPQLQQAHTTFVQQMCLILMNDNDDNLSDLIGLTAMLAKHWMRFQLVFNRSTNCDSPKEFEARYDKIDASYLLSINRLCKAMLLLLAWPKATSE